MCPADGAELLVPRCRFGSHNALDGTGTSVSAPGELTLACADGSWFHVAVADGSFFDCGRNGLDMYGIEIVPEPRAIVMLGAGVALLMGLRRRRMRTGSAAEAPPDTLA